MRKSRFTESQIIKVLKEAEGGRATTEVCREYGISSATFYKWKSNRLLKNKFRVTYFFKRFSIVL